MDINDIIQAIRDSNYKAVPSMPVPDEVLKVWLEQSEFMCHELFMLMIGTIIKFYQREPLENNNLNKANIFYEVCKNGYLPIAEYLVSFFEGTPDRDYDIDIAIDFAETYKDNQEMIEMLRKHGGRQVCKLTEEEFPEYLAGKELEVDHESIMKCLKQGRRAHATIMLIVKYEALTGQRFEITEDELERLWEQATEYKGAAQVELLYTLGAKKEWFRKSRNPMVNKFMENRLLWADLITPEKITQVQYLERYL